MKNIRVISGGPPLVQKIYFHSQRALTDLLWSKNVNVIHRWDPTDLLWSKKYYVIHGGLKWYPLVKKVEVVAHARYMKTSSWGSLPFRILPARPTLQGGLGNLKLKNVYYAFLYWILGTSLIDEISPPINEVCILSHLDRTVPSADYVLKNFVLKLRLQKIPLVGRTESQGGRMCAKRRRGFLDSEWSHR